MGMTAPVNAGCRLRRCGIGSAMGQNGAQTKSASFSDLVKLKGGEYLFSPCVSFLKKVE